MKKYLLWMLILLLATACGEGESSKVEDSDIGFDTSDQETDTAEADASVESDASSEETKGFALEPQIFTAELPEGDASVCYSFETNAEVDCEIHAGTWDLQFGVAGRSWSIWTNGGVHGTGQGLAFGPIHTDNQADFPGIESVPGWFPDIVGGAFVDAQWYAYDVLGAHDVTANYRVYAIQTAEETYRLQVLSYYDANGASARLQIRYSPIGSSDITTLEVDARAGGFGAAPDHPDNRFMYVDLEEGKILELTDEQAKTSSAWHLGFKRFDVIANSGISGPGVVKTAVAVSQDHLYSTEGIAQKSAFQALTLEDADEAFESVTSADELEFVEDRGQSFIINDGGDESWFRAAYGPGGPQFQANPDSWWIVQGGAGELYAKFHIIDVERDADGKKFRAEVFVEKRGN